MVRMGRGLVDLRPLPPGQREYVLSYVLPCPTTALSFTLASPYPILAMDLLMAAPGAHVDVSPLRLQGTRDASGATYLYFAGRDLERNTALTVEMVGLGQPGGGRTGASPFVPPAAADTPSWWFLVPALAAACLALALGIRLARLAHQENAGAESGTGGDIGSLLATIAELDERWEAGELEERRYRKRREHARQAALALMSDGVGGLRPPPATPRRRTARRAPLSAGPAAPVPTVRRRPVAKPRSSD